MYGTRSRLRIYFCCFFSLLQISSSVSPSLSFSSSSCYLNRPTSNINVELINRMIFYNKIKSVMPFCRLFSWLSAMRLLVDHTLDATNAQITHKIEAKQQVNTLTNWFCGAATRNEQQKLKLICKNQIKTYTESK